MANIKRKEKIHLIEKEINPLYKILLLLIENKTLSSDTVLYNYIDMLKLIPSLLDDDTKKLITKSIIKFLISVKRMIITRELIEYNDCYIVTPLMYYIDDEGHYTKYHIKNYDILKIYDLMLNNFKKNTSYKDRYKPVRWN